MPRRWHQPPPLISRGASRHDRRTGDSRRHHDRGRHPDASGTAGQGEWIPVFATEDRKACKQPYLIAPEQQDQGMAFADLHEWWRNKEVAGDDNPGAWLATCTIITTGGRRRAGRVHPRMPLTIAAADYDAWLDPEHQDPEELRALLTASADGHLTARPSALQSATTAPTS